MRAVPATVIVLLVCLWAVQPAARVAVAQSKEYVTIAKQEAVLKSDLTVCPARKAPFSASTCREDGSAIGITTRGMSSSM